MAENVAVFTTKNVKSNGRLTYDDIRLDYAENVTPMEIVLRQEFEKKVDFHKSPGGKNVGSKLFYVHADDSNSMKTLVNDFINLLLAYRHGYHTFYCDDMPVVLGHKTIMGNCIAVVHGNWG